MHTRFALTGLLLATAAAHAQTPIAGGLLDESAVRAFVSQNFASGPQVTRFEVQVGAVRTDALAACRRSEYFLPSGGRLWGRSSVGLRCVDGANWSLLVPVTVRAWGPALVAAGPIAAGATVGTDDVREQEAELTREAPGLLRGLMQVQGATLARALAPGQVLRQDMFRTPMAVQAGDPVKVRILDTGFAVTGTGQALNPAAVGQTVRVRTELGKILTGVAREGRTVDVAL